MICGCSWLIISAMARLSIHLSDSRPLLERPSRMRSIRPPALVSPSAFTRILRMYSSVPTPSEVCRPMSSSSLSSALVTCSRLTLVSAAIAVPMVCTSRALRCLSTSAASCSPRVSSRIAARWAPVIGASCWLVAIFAYPVPHDLRHLPGVFADQAASLADALFVLERGRGTGKPRRLAIGLRLIGHAYRNLRPRRGQRLGIGRAARHAAQQRAQQAERHQQGDQHADPCLIRSIAPGRSHSGGSGSASGATGRWNGWFTTLTLSPRAASKPTAFLVSSVSRSSSCAVNGTPAGAAPAALPAVAGPLSASLLSSTTATVSRASRPAGSLMWLMVRSSSKLRVALLDTSPLATVALDAAADGFALPASGLAAVGCATRLGGWLLSAPGMPPPAAPPPRRSLLVCSLRSAG